MRYLFAIFALLSLSVNLSAQSLRRVSPDRVGLSKSHLAYADKAIESSIERGEIPGAVLAVVKDGSLAYLKSYGNRSLKPTIVPMSDDTIFDIASCTKPVVTAILAMKLVEEGRLSLRDNLNTYIPDFNKDRKFEDKYCTIRVRNLMTHTSGLPPYLSPTRLESESGSLCRDSLVANIARMECRYLPDTDSNYSCLNFILLQHIIEMVSGESLQTLANRYIFEPLKMRDSDFIPLTLGEGLPATTKVDLRRVAATEVIEGDSILCGVVHDPLARMANGGVSGNAGLFSTASDLAILCAALLNEGDHRGTRILSPLTVKAMRSVPVEISKFGRGLGWDLYSPYSSNRGDLLSNSTFGHTGFTGTSITLDDENDLAVILLTNAIHAEDHKMYDVIRLRSLVANCVAGALRW